MNTTIKDIAKLAGVAKSTVSRYLNGGQVSKKTKERIRKVIEETKYEPNTFAQSLKARKTMRQGSQKKF
jgi:LacI family transcriptional regulator, sucrose operon repressor